jgi:hypothetical protein
MAPAMSSRGKRWVFTVNNFIPDEVLQLRQLGRDVNQCTYLVFGRETAPSGTRHLQGFVYFTQRRRGTQVKALISSRAHIELALGDDTQASDYCKKDGDFEEFGSFHRVRSNQGRRTDLDDIRTKIQEGAEEKEIADEFFSKWVVYRRSFDRYRSLLQEKRNFKTKVYVYWGDTGTGKTRRVFESEPDLWIAPDNQLNWFDGYSGQEAVLFDDFTGAKNAKFGFLLQLLDRYPLSVPIKGGFTNWRPRRCYITSNLAPDEWFFGVSNGQIAALRRRFDEVIHFNGFIN